MTSSGSKKKAAQEAKKKVSRATKPDPRPAFSEKALPLHGKKPATRNTIAPAAAPGAEVARPAPPAPEPQANERPICWIELVKSGSVFIARSNITGGSPREYKNRVLEDMLTELIVELQEEIQE